MEHAALRPKQQSCPGAFLRETLCGIGLRVSTNLKGEITITSKTFRLRLLPLAVALFRNFVSAQADSSSKAVNLDGLHVVAAYGTSGLVLGASAEFAVATQKLAIGYRYSRELHPILPIFFDNHPKRILSEINVHYLYKLSWDGHFVTFSAGPGFIFGNGRGSFIREQWSSGTSLFETTERHYESKPLNTFALSGEIQVLFSPIPHLEYGASIYGNLNRQYSFAAAVVMLKIHIFDPRPRKI